MSLNTQHKIEYLKNKYKDNQQWQALKETAKKLKPHNLTYVIKRLKASFKTYFKSLELYNQNPNLFTGEPTNHLNQRSCLN
jgi:putative transposase